MRQANFDRVARVYRWAEYGALGRTLERAREYFLPQLAGCRRALALGDGDGRFLARLLTQNPEMQAVAVDTSAAMLALLRERCGARVETVQASALEFEVGAGVDIVVTHFFLDCLTQAEVERLAGEIGRKLDPGGLWVVSDFAIPRGRWVRPLATVYVRSLYFAFRVLTGLRVKRLPDPQAGLRAAGMAPLARQEFLLGLIYTELWQRT